MYGVRGVWGLESRAATEGWYAASIVGVSLPAGRGRDVAPAFVAWPRVTYYTSLSVLPALPNVSYRFKCFSKTFLWGYSSGSTLAGHFGTFIVTMLVFISRLTC